MSSSRRHSPDWLESARFSIFSMKLSLTLDILDSLGRFRFFIIHTGLLALLVPEIRTSSLWSPFAIWTLVVGIALGWLALAFYLWRDRHRIARHMRPSA